MTMLIAPQLTGPMGLYDIPHTALFDGATGYLSRTVTVAGDRDQWGVRAIVSIDNLVNYPHIYSVNGGTQDLIYYDHTTSQLVVLIGGMTRLKTNAIFRDYTGFFADILVTFDAANATAALRCRLYINGVEVTSFATDNRAGIAVGQAMTNMAYSHRFGVNQIGTQLFVGLMAQNCIVDGSVPIPTDFGKFDTATGNWIYKNPTIGAWGTNGCYLKFDAAADMGFDSSRGSGVFSQKLTGGSSIGNTSRPDAVFDGDRHETYAGTPSAPYVAGSGLITLYAGRSWGAAKTITGFRVYATPDYGICTYGGSTLTIKLQGSMDNFSASIVDLYSASGLANTSAIINAGIDVSAAYPYHRVVIYEDTPYGASHGITVSEIEFFEAGTYAIDGNHWTVVGGVSQVENTPTNVYGTLNPLQCKASAVLSNGNKTSTNSSGISGGTAGTLAFDIATSTFEWQLTINNASFSMLGIVQVGDETITTANPATQHGYYGNTGQSCIGVSNTIYGVPYTTGDKIKVRVDNGIVNFYKWNGSAWVDQGVAWSGLTGQWLPWFSHASPGAHTVDFGQDGFVPEPGYTTLCTKNLSAVTGKNIDNHFKTVLYTGTGAVTGDTIAVTGVGFQPDFVWMKSRDTAHHHHIEDSVRGANKALLTNDSAAQYTSYQIFQSFDADGFTAKYDSAMSITSGNVNGAKTVAWCASLPDTTIPTGGTITPTGCRSNATLGMAVITYTGNGVAGATLPHPCGKKPGMFIIKRLDAAGDWPVYHQDVGATKTLRLNSTIAATLSAVFNDTAPTATLMTLGGGLYPDLNAVGGAYVAYVFYETDFCKIGSYTNNNSADGPFINEMISPVWGLFKSDSSSNWSIWDDKRPGYNGGMLALNPNSNAVEAAHEIDFTSVGVKHRQALDPNYATHTSLYVLIGQPTGARNIPSANAR